MSDSTTIAQEWERYSQSGDAPADIDDEDVRAAFYAGWYGVLNVMMQMTREQKDTAAITAVLRGWMAEVRAAIEQAQQEGPQ